MRPTVRGAVVAAVGVVLLAVGWWLELAVLRGLGGLGVALVVLAAAQVGAPLRLHVSREVERAELTRQESTLVLLRVRSTSRLWSPAADAIDQVRRGTTGVPDQAHDGGSGGGGGNGGSGDRSRGGGGTGGGGESVQRQRLRLPSLRPRGSASRSYRLQLARRGRYAIGPLAAQRTDALGLARRQAVAGGTTGLLVLPRVHRARALPAPRTRGYQGLAVDGPARGAMEFRSLREYVVGDEPRHVHWKSSARTGQLMVKELMDPQEPRLVVVLDTRAGAMSEDAFEEAVEVCASLVRASTGAGCATRLHCGRSTSPGVEPSPGPGSGSELDTVTGADGRDFLERLAVVVQNGDPRDPLVPADLLALEGAGTSLVVVTGAAEADGADRSGASTRAETTGDDTDHDGDAAGSGRAGARGARGRGAGAARAAGGRAEGGAPAAIALTEGRSLAAVQALRGQLDRAVVVRLRPGASSVGTVGGISVIEGSDARGAVARWNTVMGR